MTTSQGKLGDLQVEEEGRTLQDDSDYLFKPPVCGYSYVLGPATAPRSWTLPVLFHRAVSNYTQVKKKKTKNPDMPQLVECSLSRQKEGPRFSSQHHVSQIWEHMAVISALGR